MELIKLYEPEHDKPKGKSEGLVKVNPATKEGESQPIFKVLTF